MIYFLCATKGKRGTLSCNAELTIYLGFDKDAKISSFEVVGDWHYTYYFYSRKRGIYEVKFDKVSDILEQMLIGQSLTNDALFATSESLNVLLNNNDNSLILECPYIYNLSLNVIRIFDDYIVFFDTIQSEPELRITDKFNIKLIYTVSPFVTKHYCVFDVYLFDNSITFSLDSTTKNFKFVNEVGSDDGFYIKYLIECVRDKDKVIDYYGRAKFGKLCMLS